MKAKHLVVFLNAPPRAGKDTLADTLAEKLPNAVKVETKHSLYDDLLNHLFWWGLNDEEAIEILIAAKNREKKDTSKFYIPSFKTKFTARELLIKVSEECVKPLLGIGIYGKRLGLNICNHFDTVKQIAIVSDTGFSEEVNSCYKQVVKKYPETTFIMLQLYRDGCTFKKDSRTYIEMSGIPTYAIHNDSSISAMVTQAIKIICRY